MKLAPLQSLRIRQGSRAHGRLLRQLLFQPARQDVSVDPLARVHRRRSTSYCAPRGSNTEIGFVIDSPDLARVIADVLAEMFAGAYEVRLTDFGRCGGWNGQTAGARALPG